MAKGLVKVNLSNQSPIMESAGWRLVNAAVTWEAILTSLQSKQARLQALLPVVTERQPVADELVECSNLITRHVLPAAADALEISQPKTFEAMIEQYKELEEKNGWGKPKR